MESAGFFSLTYKKESLIPCIVPNRALEFLKLKRLLKLGGFRRHFRGLPAAALIALPSCIQHMRLTCVRFLP
jgi:hypothetical protein